MARKNIGMPKAEALRSALNTYMQHRTPPPTTKGAITEGSGLVLRSECECSAGNNQYPQAESSTIAPPPTGDARKALKCPQALADFNSLCGGEIELAELAVSTVETIRAALAPLPEVERLDQALRETEHILVKLADNSNWRIITKAARNYRQRM